jgi:hypothetical protein
LIAPRRLVPRVKRSVIAVTRKECGDRRECRPASLSRRLTDSAMALVVMLDAIRDLAAVPLPAILKLAELLS